MSRGSTASSTACSADVAAPSKGDRRRTERPRRILNDSGNPSVPAGEPSWPAPPPSRRASRSCRGTCWAARGRPPRATSSTSPASASAAWARTTSAGCETENIVALCDVDFALADPIFKKYPSAKQYKDFRVMLDEQKDIDAVIVATPDHSHAVIAMAAMQRKKHVYVQKPLTHSVSRSAAADRDRAQVQGGDPDGQPGPFGRRRRACCASGSGTAPSATCAKCTPGPTGPSGLRASRWAGPRRRPRFHPDSTGTCGSALPPVRPYHPTYHPGEVARLVGFRHRRARRHGLPHHRSAVLGAEAQVPGERRSEHLQALARLLRSRRKRRTRRSRCPRSCATSSRPARGCPPVDVTWWDGGLLPARPAALEPDRRLGNDDGGILLIGDEGIDHGRLLRRVAADRPGVQDEEVQAAAPDAGADPGGPRRSRAGLDPRLQGGQARLLATSTTPAPCPRRS